MIDSSSRGARILVGESETLPDVFDLVLSKGARTMRCGVVWHIGGVYGLAAIGAAGGEGVFDLGPGRPAPVSASGLLKARYKG